MFGSYEVYILLAVLLVVLFGVGFFLRKKKPDSQQVELASAKTAVKPSEKVQPAALSETPTSGKELIHKEAPGLKSGLGKTAKFFQSAIDKVLSGSQAETFYQDLEEVFLAADLGIGLSEKLIENLRARLGLRVPNREELKKQMSEILLGCFPADKVNPILSGEALSQKPLVLMIVGVNGAGKTTTIGKLCNLLVQKQKRSVLVGAADTFRAAATEQLKKWVEDAGAEGVFQKEGADPGAVAYDTVHSALNRSLDIAIIDTAGRLHTKSNLMDELAKVKRVMLKAAPQLNPPHEIWIVIDGTMGQNALIQAREFHKTLGLTGAIVTKLDGSAKGGALVSIVSELQIPIIAVGIGEGSSDLLPFSASEYVEGLLRDL